MCVLDGGPLAAGGGSLDHGLDQIRGLGLPAAESHERNRSVGADAAPRRLLDGLDLRHHEGGQLEVAAPRGGLTTHVVRHGEDLERPRVACELDRALRDLEAAVVIPQPDRRPRRQPTPPEHLLHGGLGAREGGDRAPQHRRRSACPLGEDQREAVEQQIACKHATRRIGSGRRGTGDVEQAAAGGREVSGEQRRAPGIEIRVAAEAHVERPQLPRGLQQQQRGVAAAVLGEGDLGLEQDHTGSPQLVERSGLRGGQQTASHIERPRPQARPGGCECPLSAPRRNARDCDGTLQECSCSRQAATRLRPAR